MSVVMSQQFNSKIAAIISILLLALALLGLARTLLAEEVPTLIINPSAIQRIPIAVPDFKYVSREQTQLAREMSDLLSNDLNISGVFRPLDPMGFLEDPQAMGVDTAQIKFGDWKRLGAAFLARCSYEAQGNSIRLDGRLFDIAGRKMVGPPRTYAGELRAWRQMVHAFADDIMLMVTGERGVFDTKIAYVQSVGGAKEIFYCDFDGNNPVQVTRDNSIALSPSWSPDQTQIAFVSYRDGAPKVYGINVSNNSRYLISGFPGMNIAPAWRPGRNELAVALSKDGVQDIYLVSPAGQMIKKCGVGFGSSISVSPSWSPDGQKFAYVSNESGCPQIYIFDVATGQKKRLTFSGDYNVSPAWSPKGDRIAYSSRQEGDFNIFLINPDGNGNHALTFGGRNESPRWSPDGRMIVYSSSKQGETAIRITYSNGTGDWQLTRQSGAQQLPDWSPRRNR
ncbi:MAG TPA: Tol-Pal system beta propeller repeat protein TolB [Syntrophobacteraceae bacterium]|nr:Tol-Pal system beta propeller repeat protein TolB [Syntrophobacteraceae bacterium]